MKKIKKLIFQDARPFILTSVTIGGSLEWYEIGLFIFWPLIIQQGSVGFEVSVAESINASTILLIVAMTLASGGARFLGGWFFGRKGDREGRRLAFPLTILVASLPSFGLAFLSFFLSYEEWIAYSTVILAIIKFLQGMPAGGELPGAICYLAEDGLHSKGENALVNQRYMCSYALIGPQIGLALSAIVCLVLKKLLPLEFLLVHAWKYVFIISGLIGVGGFIMRKILHETTDFINLKKHHGIILKPLENLFKNHSPKIIFASVISVFEIVTYSVLSILPLYYAKVFDLLQTEIIIMSLGFSVLIIILPPLIGKFSSKNRDFPWLKTSVWGTLSLSIVLYWTFLEGNFLLSLIINIAMILLFSIQVAILPALLAELFPVQIRYTGIAFSFNICDGILWSLVTSVSFLLISKYKTPYLLLFIIFTAIFFFIGSKLRAGKDVEIR